MSTRARLFVCDVEEAIPALAAEGSSYDMVVCDPPYSSGGAFRGDRAGPSCASKYQNSDVKKKKAEFKGDTRDQRSFYFWLCFWMRPTLRLAKPGGIIGVWTDWRQLATVIDSLQVSGFVFRGIYVWHKKSSRPTLGRPGNACEYLVWGTNGPRPAAGPCCRGALLCGVSGTGKKHMTEKPLDLYRELFKVVPEGGRVLELFAGSATAMRVALDMGFHADGVEGLPEIAEVASRRVPEASIVG